MLLLFFLLNFFFQLEGSRSRVSVMTMLNLVFDVDVLWLLKFVKYLLIFIWFVVILQFELDLFRTFF